MSSKSLKLILNRCITDKEFCQLLLEQRREAIKGYDLLPAERDALLRIHCQSFKELVAGLYKRGLIGDPEELVKSSF